MKRDIVVVGASAGGVEALKEFVGGIPKDFAASVFIVLHVPPHSRSYLPEILARAGELDAAHPYDGERIEPRRIYVAPPDHHILLEDGRIAVRKGPKENRFRPAVDVLFRSAAHSYGSRTIGVVLTGALDDGVAGSWAIKRLGGAVVVQDPREAAFSDMPRSVLESVKADHVASIADMAGILGRLVGEPAPLLRDDISAEKKRLEMELRTAAAHESSFRMGIMEFGELTPFTCPECHGVLVKLNEGKITRFRCHTGHAYSSSALLSAVTEVVEDTLAQAMRGLEEAVMLMQHLGEHFTERGETEVADLFRRKADAAEARSRRVREAIIAEEQLSGEGVRREAETNR